MERLSWNSINYSVRAKRPGNNGLFSRATGGPKDTKLLLDHVNGQIRGGEMLAIMGPSGAGKSTLLDVLADRKRASSGTVKAFGNMPIRSVSQYVEQHDALLGVLTVRETLWYSAKLTMGAQASAAQVNERVDAVLDGLGLRSVADHRIGTPIQRGISGGQKRRVTIGCSLVALPPILFLDEPTSGLDIQTAYEVMHNIQQFSQAHNIAVVTTIHSPNWDIFDLFNNVLLLAHGKTIYSGPVRGVAPYFEALGHPCAKFSNPADHMMRLASDDFLSIQAPNDIEGSGEVAPRPTVDELATAWRQSAGGNFSMPVYGMGEGLYKTSNHAVYHATPNEKTAHADDAISDADQPRKKSTWMTTTTLTRRNILNYQRNLLAYGVRFGMYVGMGVLLATVWVNLKQDDAHVQDRLSVHFFSVAFLGFMSVAGIPSFLEERSVFRRERANGMYTPGPFVLANTIVMLPFMFGCALVFAVLCYWSIGLHDGAVPFFRWLAFLYLGVLAAEMQSLLIAALVPIFVAALALAAFLNGFWMCTQGYFIRTASLPRFWYYWAHFINYETYAFDLLATTDLKNLLFPCNSCECQWPKSAHGSCASSGNRIIEVLQLDEVPIGGQAGILISIIVIYRILFYVVLKLQRL